MSTLYSMTGFAKVSDICCGKKVILEIRSLNSNKGSDISLKLSPYFRPVEFRIRQLVSDLLLRGKIDVSLYPDPSSVSEVSFNTELIKSYYKSLNTLASDLSAPSDGLLAAILRMPEVSGDLNIEWTDDEIEQVDTVVTQACKHLQEFRIREGETLVSVFNQLISEIESQLNPVKEADKLRVLRIRERLKENMEVYIPIDKIDPNRFEQEVVYYIEKLDISEELSRLQMHCNHFREVISGAELLKGRKLNFIAQEIGREINTIGSKANDAIMQKSVVLMKDSLEKIKEQTNNVL